MDYGDALRIILEEKGIKQADLARRINMSTAYVSQLCIKKIKEPTLSRALQIADALDVSIDRFAELMSEE